MPEPTKIPERPSSQPKAQNPQASLTQPSSPSVSNPPTPSASPPTSSPSPGKKFWLVPGIVLGCLGLIAVGVISLRSPTPNQSHQTAPSTNTAAPATAPLTDTISPAIAATRKKIWDQEPPLAIAPATAEQKIQAIAQHPEWAKGDLVAIKVWDDCAEDGDVITIASDATCSDPIMLRHAGHVVILPRPTSGFLTITGIRDGGGGITLGISSAAAPRYTPVIQPSEKLSVPVK